MLSQFWFYPSVLMIIWFLVIWIKVQFFAIWIKVRYILLPIRMICIDGFSKICEITFVLIWFNMNIFRLIMVQMCIQWVVLYFIIIWILWIKLLCYFHILVRLIGHSLRWHWELSSEFLSNLRVWSKLSFMHCVQVLIDIV